MQRKRLISRNGAGRTLGTLERRDWKLYAEG